MKPSQHQVGGNHYKSYVIQPAEFIYKNCIGFLEGNVIKYVCRHAAKNGRADLLKARHYIDLLLEWKYGSAGADFGVPENIEVAYVCKNCGAFADEHYKCPNGC